MNNLLFYALLAVLLWYFFYYLPSQKKTSRPDLSKPAFKTQSTQTEPLTYEPESVLNCPGPIIGPSAQTPGSYPFSESERTELEQTLDFLIKELKEIDKALD